MSAVKSFTRHKTTMRSSIRLPIMELVQPALGFFARFDSRGVTEITNIKGGESYQFSDTTRVFTLARSEHVVRVVYAMCSKARIAAIRFETNQRTSQWFGVPSGSQFKCEATKGTRIHALCVEKLNGFCSKMEAVIIPITQRETIPLGPYKPSLQILAPYKGDRSFFSWADDVGAFVIDCTSLSVQVLSTRQTERYLKFQDVAHLEPSEHVELLAAGELILSVEYTIEDDALSAFCLITSHRTTPWFGKPNYSERKRVGSRGGYVHGFSGSVSSSSNKVVSLSVLVTAFKRSMCRPILPSSQ